MADVKVVRLSETEVVKFGPDATYQLILGDDDGTTPIRTGIQTSEPGYVAPVHSHPYMEVLHILDGVAEAWVDGQEDRKVRLEKGDTIALPPNAGEGYSLGGGRIPRLVRMAEREVASGTISWSNSGHVMRLRRTASCNV